MDVEIKQILLGIYSLNYSAYSGTLYIHKNGLGADFKNKQQNK